jgi:UrcA family protein
MKTLIILTAAAALGLGLAGTTTAQPVTQTVSFADLDVGSPAGEIVFARRVANTAAAVCGIENGTTDLASHIAARACRAKAIAITMLAFAMKSTPQFASR